HGWTGGTLSRRPSPSGAYRSLSMNLLNSGLPRLALGVLPAVLAACLGKPAASGGLAQVKDADVTSAELQLGVFEGGRTVSSVIEPTADTIIMRSSDPAVRRSALLWKATGIPLAQEAALQRDPLVSAVDLWGFAIQQRNYFTTGGGATAFGPQQPLA